MASEEKLTETILLGFNSSSNVRGENISSVNGLVKGE